MVTRKNLTLHKSLLCSSLLFVIALGNTYSLFARNRVLLSAKQPVSAQITSKDKGAIYVISDSIDLKKQKITLPQDAILKFEGGLFLNGEIIGKNATIEAGRYDIFKSVTLSGTWMLDKIPVEWFGAMPNSAGSDCSPAINQSIITGVAIGVPAYLGAGTYYTKRTIDIPEGGSLVGSSPSSTTIRYDADAGVGVYLHGQNITLRDVCVREHKMERKGICIKMGDVANKVSCTRGYVEDIKAMGGKRGLDLEYQWCNKICGVSCRYNDVGLYANATTPYVENAIVEGNYQCGVLAEGAGVKLYNAVIEGNKVGCILNGKEHLLNNCYFEGNTASARDKEAAKDAYSFDVEGGHIYAGEQATINNLVMIGCHIVNTYRNNNTIKVDKCLNFTAIGCNALSYLELTENCTVKYIDESFETVEDYGEYSLASRVPKGFSAQEPRVFERKEFREVVTSGTEILLDDNGYYRLNGNKSRFKVGNEDGLLCYRADNVKYREILFRVSDPQVLKSGADIILSSSVQYPDDMRQITPSQSVSLTGKKKNGKQITVPIGKGHTSTNQKVRAGQTATYEVRIKHSYIENLMQQNDIEEIEYLTMNNSLVYGSTKITSDKTKGSEFKLVGVSVSTASAR